MKKSKFLKKSLAMLLAVMLVVAMIPLSAAAASPNFQAAYAAATGDAQGALTQEGNTLTGSYRSGAPTVDLTLVVGSNAQVYYTNKDETAPIEQKVDVDNNKAHIPGLEVADYSIDAKGTLEISISVDGVDYTVVLNPVEASTETKITDFELNRVLGSEIPNWEEASIGVDFVSVTMPYDSVNSKVTYQIRNMAVSEDAIWTIIHKDGSPADTGDDEGIVNGNPVVTVEDGDKIIITNGGKTQEYTLHINIADGFTSFATAEGLDEKMFTDSGDIVALLPFGTAAGANSGDITVTPIFDLDYPGATAYWNDGDKRVEINGVDDAITIDSDIIVDGTLLNSTEKGPGWGATYHCYQGNTPDDWAWRVENCNAFSDFTEKVNNNTSINGVGYAKENGYSAQLTVVYADESERTYNVYFCETQLNNEAAITDLVIGSEQADIDQETKTIDITLPNGTDLSNLVLNSDTTTMKMTASYGAEIAFVNPTGDNVTLIGETNPDRSATETFTSTDTIDAREPISVVVRSQDYDNHTKTEEIYTLNVNATSEYTKAEITSFTIQNGDKYIYTASVENGGIDKNGNVLLKVPYSVYNRGKLNGWKFYYTKSVGSLATCDSKALPLTGSTIEVTGFDFLPANIGDGTEGKEIVVGMVGEDLTKNGQKYRIEIQRNDPAQGSTLTGITLVGKEAYEVPGASTQYKGQVNNNADPKTATAKVSWTAGQYWTGAQMEGILEAAEGQNVRIFYENAYGNYMEFVDTPDDNATTVSQKNLFDVQTASGNKGSGQILYDGSTIYVLGERTWVELEPKLSVNSDKVHYFESATNNLPDLLDKTNTSDYTKYELTLGVNDPEEGASLGKMTLLDGTGWEASLKIDVKGSVLQNLEVPYALTSDLDENGVLKENGKDTSVNPVFLTYDFGSANRMYVMGRDIGLAVTDEPNKLDNPSTIPTAGDYTSIDKGDAVFYDMAKYDGQWTEDKYEDYVMDGNPFLLISREGDVYVYNYDKGTNKFEKNTAVQKSKLFICSESGDKMKQEFNFKLKVSEPNAGTDFASFYFTGYERFPATVDAANHTISVVLPFGTEYTYLIPNFELTADSQGAIITVDDPDLLGKPVRKGVTNVNFTSTRKFTVIAENETTRAEWTVNVSVADEFSDVTTKDWFYNDVMAAAGFGYVNGMGNGKYEPYGTTTRAQFAKILAEALGYDASAYTTSAFPDVSEDHWAMAAIAFCADQEIILGYETGNFEPSKTITRQEAALMLQRAFDLVGTESTQYPDDASIAGWAEDGVYAVKHAGLMKGDADTGNFRPTSTLNRAEMATILMNAHRAGLIK